MNFPDFDRDAFLRDHWQHRPLLIRNPWAAWRNPLEPDELAGLACEAEIESRLIVRGRSGGLTLEEGPFDSARFAKLGRSPWTLLVRAVDHHVPDVAALIAPFRFIPNWRIDDVMVSYATDGGGVGAHFDQYDVFLVQGLGRRRWSVGARCDAGTALLPHDDLRLLADFETVEEWVLEPGDILYVPPGFAHDGVALGDDCMTYSIGFRAPSRSDLIENWAAHVLETMDDDDRYADPGLIAQDNPGEISPGAIAALHAMMTDAVQDRASFARWFGTYSSAPKYPDMDWRPDAEIAAGDVRAFIADATPLSRNPASRFAFVRGEAGAVSLFADGACFDCAGAVAGFAERLCAEERMTIDPALAESDAAMALVAALFNQGSVVFEAED